MAPELLRAQGQPSPAADIYSLGATLSETATGETHHHMDEALTVHGGSQMACTLPQVVDL